MDNELSTNEIEMLMITKELNEEEQIIVLATAKSLLIARSATADPVLEAG